MTSPYRRNLFVRIEINVINYKVIEGIFAGDEVEFSDFFGLGR